jgi:ribose 5-phosphate isomerase B
MNIYIGADHAGFELKEKIKLHLIASGHTVTDNGAFSMDTNDDYPDFIHPTAQAVAADTGSYGIVLGGSGQGEMIAANKIKGIRAALFYGSVLPKTSVAIDGRMSSDAFEIVKLARLHNNANVLSLAARFIDEEEAKQAVDVFIQTQFSNEERHVRRISKLETL